MSHINALKRAGPPRRASKSKLRTHNKVRSWPAFFLDNFSFYKFCLFMCRLENEITRTCMQISGFVGK